jgi:glycerate-2-kinase
VLSDVVGAGPSHVASGPSLGANIGTKAAEVLARYRLDDSLLASVVSVINQSSPAPERREPYSVVGSTEVAADAAARYLASRGVVSTIATTELEGEARVEARAFIGDAARGVVTIATGETTVTVVGDGVGGRNQEAALAAAIDCAGDDTVFLACGTDGIDGPTPAAGAVVDGQTLARAQTLGLDLHGFLAINDSYTALDALDAVVLRGDTGTNVADLWMVAKGIDPGSNI